MIGSTTSESSVPSKEPASSPTPSPARTTVCAISSYLGSPISQSCCEEPIKCAIDNIINLSANFNFWLFSTPVSLAGRVLSSSGTYMYDFFSEELKNNVSSAAEPLKHFGQNFTRIGSDDLPDRPPLYLIDLVGPAVFLYYSMYKVKTSVIEIFKPLSLLSRGIFLNEWTHKADLNYCKYIGATRKHTFCGLFGKILEKSAKASAWGALAFITQRGMRNAVANATGNPLGQDAITILTAIIAFTQLASLPFYSPKTSKPIRYQPAVTQRKTVLPQNDLYKDYQLNLLNGDDNEFDPIPTKRPKEIKPIRLPALDDPFDDVNNFGYL